jgi:hypothetical protein
VPTSPSAFVMEDLESGRKVEADINAAASGSDPNKYR